jgi:hypothetical protein
MKLNTPIWGKFKKFWHRSQSHLIAAFLPWIFFSVVHAKSIFLASICSIILMGFLNFRELKKGFVMPWGSVVVFTILALNDRFMFSKWMVSNDLILINSALAAIVWFSMIINKPFTIQYAREEVERSRWNHPIFLKINWILTSIWAVLMTIMALPRFFLTSDQISSSWFLEYGLTMLCVLIGFKCNTTIPKMFGRRV